MSKYYVGKKLAKLDKSPALDAYTKVVVIVGEDEETGDQLVYSAGNDTGRTLEINNPWGTQQMANDILAQISGYRYRPYEAQDALLSDDAEIGDAVTMAGGVYGTIVKQSIIFDDLCASSVSAPSADETENEFGLVTPNSSTDRAISRKFNHLNTRFTVELGKIETEITDTAEGLSTRITQTAQSIEAEVRRATSAEGDLSGRIVVNADAITAEVRRATSAEGDLSGRIVVNADAITAEVRRAQGAESVITQRADSIRLSVSSSNGSSSFTLTDNTGTLDTDTLNLTVNSVNIHGALTVSQLPESDGAVYVPTEMYEQYDPNKKYYSISRYLDPQTLQPSFSAWTLWPSTTLSYGQTYRLSDEHYSVVDMSYEPTEQNESYDSGTTYYYREPSNGERGHTWKVWPYSSLSYGTTYKAVRGITTIVGGVVTTDYVNALGVSADSLTGSDIAINSQFGSGYTVGHIQCFSAQTADQTLVIGSNQAMRLIAHWGDLYCSAEHGYLTLGAENGVSVQCNMFPTGYFNLGNSGSLHQWETIYLHTSPVITSDRKAKKDISYGLEPFDQFFDGLNPCSYRLKENAHGRKHFGMIAQDVEQLIADCGLSTEDVAAFIKSYDEETGEYSYSLRYTEFIPLMIWEIQQLKAKVKELTT